MIKRLIHIIFVLPFLLGFSSCVFENQMGCNVETLESEDSPLVKLTFSVIAISGADSSATRAETFPTPNDSVYFEEATNEYELIHYLRVIIIRENGLVEQNRMVRFENGVIRYDNLEFRVHSEENKRIYLLANAENLGYEFDNLKPGTSYDAKSIENIIIKSSGSDNVLFNNTNKSSSIRYLPMTEMHEVKVGKSDSVIDPLFITRAYVKFSFDISSDYGSGIWLKNIIVNKLANQEYLLPKDAEYTDFIKNWDGISTWGDLTDPDLYGMFITSFDIPIETDYSSVVFTLDEPFDLSSTENKKWNPSLYFCESKYDNPYSISIKVAEKDSEGNFLNERDYSFKPIDLLNLPLLPRNTHVKVKIKLSKGDVKCEVELVPYIGINLNPQFGVERAMPSDLDYLDNIDQSDCFDPQVIISGINE